MLDHIEAFWLTESLMGPSCDIKLAFLWLALIFIYTNYFFLIIREFTIYLSQLHLETFKRVVVLS